MSKKEELACIQGAAYDKALEYAMYGHQNLQIVKQDYIVTLICNPPTGIYVLQNDELVWIEPAKDENKQIKISVQDHEDHRFIPSLNVVCGIYNNKGSLLGQKQQNFTWDPYLYSYCQNWSIPEQNNCSIKIKIFTPYFSRHDQMTGKRYLHDLNVVMEPIHLKIK